ncbi:septum formation family protein [Yinghuangia sp. ASG 101]|uniref:septum formation family protein n=1 Tax=Yinghuangia sp. ASG 101 TaxID=2896848 RepID=UPI001E52A504|nr:septum formation family protein [Yinghuangia sp. ASG 101]UGQ10093.1 septum formation family protein [Yinghuangia sp. ASG 101]
MRPGDCVVFPPGTGEVNKVSCSSPHDAEHVENLDMADGPWPGDAEAERQAGELCEAAIKPIVARQPNAGDLAADYIFPSEGSWEEGDREVQCMIRDAGGKLNGPLV